MIPEISILICSLSHRYSLLESLIKRLTQKPYTGSSSSMNFNIEHRMIKSGIYILSKFWYSNVEIIAAIDDKIMTTGAKRSLLLNEAKGTYVIFIDDDDEVPEYYISYLLSAAKSGADCFAINGTMTTNGGNEIKWFLAKDNPNDTVMVDGKPAYRRTTNHITAVKRELALQAGFPDISLGEDKAYSEALKPFLKTEFVIKPPMYHYKFSTFNKQY